MQERWNRLKGFFSIAIWLLIPVLVWLLFYVAQSVEPLFRGIYAPMQQAEISVSDPKTGETGTLTVVFPRVITVDTTITQVLSLALSPTPNSSPNMWFFKAEVGEGDFVLTDEKGQIVQTIAIAAGEERGPSNYYLRPADPHQAGETVSLRLSLSDNFGRSRSAKLLFIRGIPVEARVVTFIFRFARIGAQPALLAALLTGLVGFGVKRWEHTREKERRQKERILGEVDGLNQMLQERHWSRALRTYLSFSGRTGWAWGDLEVQGRIQEVWKIEAPDPLRLFVRCGRCWENMRKGNLQIENKRDQMAGQTKGKETAPSDAEISQQGVESEEGRTRAEDEGDSETLPSGGEETAQVDTESAQQGVEGEEKGKAQDEDKEDSVTAQARGEKIAQSDMESAQQGLESREGDDWWKEASEAKDMEAKDVAEALLWASQNLVDGEYEQATKMMASLLTLETIMAVHEVLRREEARTWLWEPDFEGPLQKIAAASIAPQRARDAARELLNIRAKSRSRPPLWTIERPARSEAVKQVIEEWQIKFNPFGPERAEQDPLLPEYQVQPPWWLRAAALEPTLVVGPVGSGKTATALLLAHDWFRRNEVFPVYAVTAPPVLPTARAALEQLAGLLADVLVEFLARDPTVLDESSLPQQAAMARLLLQWLGPRERLVSRFAVAGLSCEQGIGHSLISTVESLVGQGTLESRSTDLFHLLGRARPDRRQATVFLLEPLPGQSWRDTAQRIRSLLDLAIPLSRVGVYLKIFLPEGIEPLIDWESAIVQIVWSPGDLVKIIEERLHLSGVESLMARMTIEARHQRPDINDFLSNLAQGSPRRLIQLGNQLLEQVGQGADKRIRPLHLNALQAWAENDGH